MVIKSLIGSVSYILLFLALSSAAQNPILDTNGQPLRSGVEYYIRPAITDNGGRFTLIKRNESCPLFVGQENVTGPEGFPVTFTPFAVGETVIRAGRDVKVTFSALTTCIQSTSWKLGETDPESQRRLIVTGETDPPATPGKTDRRSAASYFQIERNEELNVYNFGWCPTEVCPTCRFLCGRAGVLVENGKRLIALDGSVLPVIFERSA